jgi:transcriptional regulator with XRE-family HTH domain
MGETLATLSEKAAISLPYMSDVERGTRLPSLDVLARIADALGCLATDLLAGVYPYGSSRKETRSRGRPGRDRG